MAAVISLTLLIVFCLIGIVLAAFAMPGTWLILVSTILYDWYYGWQRIGWRWLVALGVAALIAEGLEMLASVAAAKRAGASRRAAVGALVGGFAGMLLFSVPVPIIGTIIGGLIGCFVGAVGAELTVKDDLAKGAKVGLFATMGRLGGLMAKTAAAMAMAGAAVSLAVMAK